MNHYEILGLSQAATPAEIRAAYLALSKVVHPDAGGDDYQFAVLEQSYRVLSDPTARARHDRELAAAAGPGATRPGPSTTSPRHQQQAASPDTAAGRYLTGCFEDIASYLVLGAVWLVITGLVFVALSAGGNPSAAVRSGSIAGWLLVVGALVVGLVARLRRR
ncbi:MAG: DnaJ domain-containing protein [Actinomycetota bacterium]